MIIVKERLSLQTLQNNYVNSKPQNNLEKGLEERGHELHFTVEQVKHKLKKLMKAALTIKPLKGLIASNRIMDRRFPSVLLKISYPSFWFNYDKFTREKIFIYPFQLHSEWPIMIMMFERGQVTKQSPGKALLRMSGHFRPFFACPVPLSRASPWTVGIGRPP